MRTDEILIFNPKYIWFLQFFNRHKDNHQVKSTLMLLILPEIFGDKKPNTDIMTSMEKFTLVYTLKCDSKCKM